MIIVIYNARWFSPQQKFRNHSEIVKIFGRLLKINFLQKHLFKVDQRSVLNGRNHENSAIQ